MKKSVKNYFSHFVALIAFSLLSVASFAQDKGVDVDINVKKESTWYQQSWVWVIGAAVFVLLLVALLRGSSTQKE